MASLGTWDLLGILVAQDLMAYLATQVHLVKRWVERPLHGCVPAPCSRRDTESVLICLTGRAGPACFVFL